jgi:hypothetical protein
MGSQSTSTVVAASASGLAGGVASATLPASSGKTTYLTGLHYGSAIPLAVVSGTLTVTGLAAGTLSFMIAQTVASGSNFYIPFYTPLPASGTNVPIVFNHPAILGGALYTITAWGFQQ